MDKRTRRLSDVPPARIAVKERPPGVSHTPRTCDAVIDGTSGRMTPRCCARSLRGSRARFAVGQVRTLEVRVHHAAPGRDTIVEHPLHDRPLVARLGQLDAVALPVRARPRRLDRRGDAVNRRQPRRVLAAQCAAAPRRSTPAA